MRVRTLGGVLFVLVGCASRVENNERDGSIDAVEPIDAPITHDDGGTDATTAIDTRAADGSPRDASRDVRGPTGRGPCWQEPVTLATGTIREPIVRFGNEGAWVSWIERSPAGTEVRVAAPLRTDGSLAERPVPLCAGVPVGTAQSDWVEFEQMTVVQSDPGDTASLSICSSSGSTYRARIEGRPGERVLGVGPRLALNGGETFYVLTWAPGHFAMTEVSIRGEVRGRIEGDFAGVEEPLRVGWRRDDVVVSHRARVRDQESEELRLVRVHRLQTLVVTEMPTLTLARGISSPELPVASAWVDNHSLAAMPTTAEVIVNHSVPQAGTRATAQELVRLTDRDPPAPIHLRLGATEAWSAARSAIIPATGSTDGLVLAAWASHEGTAENGTLNVAYVSTESAAPAEGRAFAPPAGLEGSRVEEIALGLNFRSDHSYAVWTQSSAGAASVLRVGCVDGP